MTHKLITPPNAMAVTLAEAKMHLGVDIVEHDAMITSKIFEAQEACAHAMGGRAVLPTTYEISLDAFPNAFELTRPPVLSVTSIIYVDQTGTPQTMAGSAYKLDNSSDYASGYVVPAYGTVWPATRDEINAVRLRYVAGWATPADVPDAIKGWIKLLVGALYINREAESVGETFKLGFAERLLDAHRIY